MNTNPKRILLINNQESITNKIKTLITKETKLDTANSYKKVEQKIEEKEYQLIMLNNQIAQTKEICTYIKDKTKTPILILTDKTDFKYIKECLEYGAEYVITKKTDINHLKAIIYKTCNRQLKDTNNHIEYRGIHLFIRNQYMTYRNSKILLTENETVILEYMFNQKDYCSLENIFTHLNKQEIKINEDSLRVCICRLRKKILNQTGLDIIKNRYGIGYYISI